MVKRLVAVVDGRVQGVGYRASVHRRVVLLNVTGYVKNLSDGCVEIVAEGSEAELLAVLEIAREGSGWSSVKNIDISYMPATGEFSLFTIAY